MLTNFPVDPYLDLPAYRGQRIERYTFEWRNGVTNELLGYLTPEKSPAPSLSHDTGSAIKRRLTLNLGTFDTSRIDPITDRVLPFVTIGDTTYPLGRYMFTNESDLKSTSGSRGSFTLLDEGFIIEQELDAGFYSTLTCDSAILALLAGLPLRGIRIEPTQYDAVGSFSVGTNRGQAMSAYATQGDYFPYWLANDGLVRMIRTIDPGNAVPDFDFDAGFKVRRDTIHFESDVITAFNRFVVIGNSAEASTSDIVGVYDVPPTAPHSIAKRGFAIQSTETLQIGTLQQATAMARNIGIQSTVYERISLATAFDPRHDSYNVIHFEGSNWLELSWQAELIPGGAMQHTMRKAYK